VLYGAEQRGELARSDPRTAHSRLRALPAERIGAALDTIYDVHLELARHGFVAVDFYDGSILYDFTGHRTWVCDLDSYRPGPFVLEAERLPGSTRFMAPEEFARGALVDGVTNVFTLGRAALILLGDGGHDPGAWQGNPAQWEVALRASRDERSERYPSVAEFVRAWRSASTTASG
jgi:serine/threonine-protein kinase